MAVAAIALLPGCGSGEPDTPAPRAVLDSYRSVAYATYDNALTGAEALQAAIAALAANPSARTLAAARTAWRAARVPYSQTEALRFGNWFVDDWEGGVNAWPLDEGFIDYVDADYVAASTNPLARANLINTARITIDGRTVDTEPLQRRTLVALQSLSNIETNVVTGYHAIEFLLWGQDRSATAPGQRPWTDFANTADTCTDGPDPAPLRHCQRRHAFLAEVTEQLRLDLAAMTTRWGPQAGSYGMRLVDGDPADGLRRALFGLAMLSGEELAGERMTVALLANAPEEEQDCFSDDTHHSLYFNALGVDNLYFGRLATDPAGAADAPSLASLARATDPALARRLEAALADTRQAMDAIRAAGEAGRTVDTLIAPGNADGAALMQAGIAALRHQAEVLTELGAALALGPLNPSAPRPDARSDDA